MAVETRRINAGPPPSGWKKSPEAWDYFINEDHIRNVTRHFALINQQARWDRINDRQAWREHKRQLHKNFYQLAMDKIKGNATKADILMLEAYKRMEQLIEKENENA